MRLSLVQLVRATRGRLILGYPKESFSRVSIDTRTLQPGDVFFALKGPRFDGHDYLRTAIERGALAAVVQSIDQRIWDHARIIPNLIQVDDTVKALQDLASFVRQQSRAVIIGITGSNGKTTTKEMLASILRRKGKTLATRGNLNNHIGLPLTLLELEEDHQFAVIEMGTSKKGDMNLLVDILQPTVGLITNVGKDHLEFLGTPEGVLNENRALFDRLPVNGLAVINDDDVLLRALGKQFRCKVIRYGEWEQADVRYSDIKAWPLPLSFTLHLGADSYPTTLQAVGAIQVVNAAAAAAVAKGLAIPPENILGGLFEFKSASMRLQSHELPDGTILLNDAYNANPSSVRASIESFCRSYPDRQRWAVLADMRELGSIARSEHADLGRWLAEQKLDRILLYGRDMRFAEETARAAGARVDRFRKKRYLIAELQKSIPGAPVAILFKGSRSLRLEQVIQPLLGPTPAMAAH